MARQCLNRSRPVDGPFARGDARPEVTAAQAAPAASGPGFDGIADELAKLDELAKPEELRRARGLSDHEFEQAKARVPDG